MSNYYLFIQNPTDIQAYQVNTLEQVKNIIKDDITYRGLNLGDIDDLEYLKDYYVIKGTDVNVTLTSKLDIKLTLNRKKP